MSGVNKVIIMGRLGQDPELKVVGQNQSVARLSVATSETWLKDGQKQERTEWHRVVVWGKQADNCAKFLTKGRQVFIEGKLQTRSWEDSTSGQKKYSTEIVANNVQFIGGAAGASTDRSNSQEMGPTDFGPEPSFDASDDIPF